MPIQRPLGAQQGFIALITRSEQQPDKCSFDVKARLYVSNKFVGTGGRWCHHAPVHRSRMQRQQVPWQPSYMMISMRR